MEAGRTAAPQPTAIGLSRRPRSTNLEGAGAQLSDHHQRPQSGDDPGEGHLSQLGHSVYRQAGLCIAPSCRVAREDQRTRSAPASGILLSATRRAAMPAAASAAGPAGGEQEAPSLGTTLPDSLDRTAPGGGAAGHLADPAPVSHQAAAMDLWPVPPPDPQHRAVTAFE